MADKLNKKRVKWTEKDAITGEVHNEEVDVYTSPDAVLFEDGTSLDQKLEEINQKIEEHIQRSDNPHKSTPSSVDSISKDEFSTLEQNILDHSTVISPNIGYTEVGEWGDGNPDNENRLGYFVSVDKSDAGITMVKATSDSDVRGVTISNPAFGGNATLDKFDKNGRLLSKYNYVTFAGFAEVYDDGRCTINSRCVSDDDGKAIPSNNTMGYQVIERISDNKILILVEPNADMLNRIKTDIDTLEKNTTITDNKKEYVYRFGVDNNGVFLQVADIL